MKKLFTLSCLLIPILLYGQEPSGEKPSSSQLPVASPGSWLTRPLPLSAIKDSSSQQTVAETKAPRRDSAARSSGSGGGEAQPGPRRITLEEAEQQAASSVDPMLRLGQLQMEAAKQHREAAEGDYFPKIGSTLTNLHFNKFMGQLITVQRPIVGGTSTLSLPLAEGRLERSIPIQFSLGEGIDIGQDTGSPIDFTYKLPFAFTGKIDHVTIELKPEATNKRVAA